MGRPGQTGIPLGERRRAGAPRTAERAVEMRPGARHVWVVGVPDQPGRWPGVLCEWRRAADGRSWDGRVAFVLPEPSSSGTRLVERWLPADCLCAVEA